MSRPPMSRKVTVPYEVLHELLEAEFDDWFAVRGIDSDFVVAKVSVSSL